jgi:raffinose/stachyose/melibiose transport system substrate-binding protein
VKKLAAVLLIITLCLGLMQAAMAEGVTIRTVSTFAGTDAAAGAYVELLRAWEKETGNKVEDTSATSDEAWKTGVLNDFAAGNEADVLFYFARTADSAPILSRVVPISEINAAYPNLMLKENPLSAEADGVIYSIPVRPFWEGLFVNTDLFSQYDLELPTDWAKLETAIRKFNEVGIVPISVSFADVPHYIVEFLIIACGTPEEHKARPSSIEEVPDSWKEGMALLNKLNKLGAFARDASATTEAVTSQLFRDKKAAMQLDGSWFANGIPEANWNTTAVMPFPAYAADADPNAFIGGVSMGFYLSRKAWNDPTKRDAAVDLLAFLTNEENGRQLSTFAFGGELLQSSYKLLDNEQVMLPPIQDAMNAEARSAWFAMIPALVDGSADPIKVWADVMALNPFGK